MTQQDLALYLACVIEHFGLVNKLPSVVGYVMCEFTRRFKREGSTHQKLNEVSGPTS